MSIQQKMFFFLLPRVLAGDHKTDIALGYQNQKSEILFLWVLIVLGMISLEPPINLSTICCQFSNSTFLGVVT